MPIVKIVELMGVSETSFDDAVKQAVEEAAKTIRNITGIEVIKMTAEVEGSEVFEYHVTVRLAFLIDRSQGAADDEDSADEEEDAPDEESADEDEESADEDSADEDEESADEDERK
jgi:flavin-binding protein dodecin